MEKFNTSKRTIEQLLNDSKIQFVIPTYQRPYVWDSEEILKLLNDIYDAFEIDKNSTYFIGNVYVTKGKENKFDVIDGQQRFTTLWLAALAFKSLKITSAFESFLGTDKNLRLNFSIRKEVAQYLNSMWNGGAVHLSKNEVSSNEFLKNIAKGIETIKGFLSTLDKELLAYLATYFYSNVTFVYNIAPLNTDLNNLFTALGSSGVQLEQTDILKAKLLKKIEGKVLYAKMWEACENMDDFFENNVLSIFSKTDRNKLELDTFSNFDKQIFILPDQLHTEGSGIDEQVCISPDQSCNEADKIKNSISNILKLKGNVKINATDDPVETKVRCKSIIPFSVLLLHTYRLMRTEDFKHPFNKNNLLDNFEDLIKDQGEIPCFFKTLWHVRYLFDKYIIKWREDNENDEAWNDEQKLRLTSQYRNDNSFYRENRSQSELSMLQSILYFTGGFNQQYWITPFLSYLKREGENKALDDKNLLDTLEKIDNLILPGDKKGITFQLMDADELDRTVEDVIEKVGVKRGTGFNHYWFYKVEYLLWKGWK